MVQWERSGTECVIHGYWQNAESLFLHGIFESVQEFLHSYFA
jgi:hypothetical protein